MSFLGIVNTAIGAITGVEHAIGGATTSAAQLAARRATIDDWFADAIANGYNSTGYNGLRCIANLATDSAAQSAGQQWPGNPDCSKATDGATRAYAQQKLAEATARLKIAGAAGTVGMVGINVAETARPGTVAGYVGAVLKEYLSLLLVVGGAIVLVMVVARSRRR